MHIILYFAPIKFTFNVCKRQHNFGQTVDECLCVCVGRWALWEELYYSPGPRVALSPIAPAFRCLQIKTACVSRGSQPLSSGANKQCISSTLSWTRNRRRKRRGYRKCTAGGKLGSISGQSPSVLDFLLLSSFFAPLCHGTKIKGTPLATSSCLATISPCSFQLESLVEPTWPLIFLMW